MPSVVWDGRYTGHSTFLITLKIPARGALSDLRDRVYNRVVSKENGNPGMIPLQADRKFRTGHLEKEDAYDE